MQSPCPHRIIDDLGYAFCMGSVGSSVWYGVSGYRNAPKGLFSRLKGSAKSIATRSPVMGGNFAMWGLCFSSFDCLFLHLRKKDDPLNAIFAGSATGATLAWRNGFSIMTRAALMGGLFLAVIEGLGIMVSKAVSGNGEKYNGPVSEYSRSIKVPQKVKFNWDLNDEIFFDDFGENHVEKNSDNSLYNGFEDSVEEYIKFE